MREAAGPTEARTSAPGGSVLTALGSGLSRPWEGGWAPPTSSTQPPAPRALLSSGPRGCPLPNSRSCGSSGARQAGGPFRCPGSTQRQPGPGAAPVPHTAFSSSASVGSPTATPHKADRTRWGSVSSSQAATGPMWPLSQRSRRPDLPRSPLEKVLMHIWSLCGSGSFSGTGPRV